MNAAQLFYDVKKRLTSDTGTNGLYAPGAVQVTGIFNNWASPTQDMPYIVWTLVSGVPDETFATNEDEIVFQLSVFTSKRPPDMGKAQKILNRIYGNGVKQSTRLPTYGLHRHTLVSSYPDGIETTDDWGYTACHAGGEFSVEGEDFINCGREWKLRMYQTFASVQET